MFKVKSRVPEAASEGFDATSSFIDQLVHDKTFRRKLHAASKASAAASRRAQTQARRRGITSLASDPVLRTHLLDAVSQLQAARAARKTPGHKTRNLVALATAIGAMVAATLKLRHRLAEKQADTIDNA